MFLKSKVLTAVLGTAISISLFTNHVLAADPIEICFENHQFKPLNLTVPTGQALIIKVINSSNETIEFESFSLNREKAISPGESILVRLPALSAGSYDFYDDFHQDVPQGSIVAK